LDLRMQYEAMTNEELLNLAKDSEQLSTEARNLLGSELLRRGIRRGEVGEYGVRIRFLGVHIRFFNWMYFWKYRQQTGEWPRRSIAFYVLQTLIEGAALILVVGYIGQHGWSKELFLLVVLPLITVDVVVSSWLEDRIRLSEIARHRHARGL
jgi:hypothetical protein